MRSTASSRPIEPVQLEDVLACTDRLGIVVDSTEAEQLPGWVERLVRFVSSLETLPSAPEHPPRSREFCWATRDEDPLNAFITLCSVRGRGQGPLYGLKVAVKDCIAVAGIPLTDGGGREPYAVPSRDAIVVERVLRAGADIVGKTNMEDMAVGSGIGSHFGPTANPLHPGYQAGGSSSGSAAAVGAGLADVALGTDQAGSIRIPAAWCGLVGMKPTHGLVPTQGMTRMDPTLDHIGPITRDVATNALAFACLAGVPYGEVDWSEQQHRPSRGLASDRRSVKGARIGLVKQSVLGPPLTESLRRTFDDAIATLRRLGATVEDAHVPLWTSAISIFTGVVAHGMLGMWTSGGCGFGIAEALDGHIVERAPSHRSVRSTELPPRMLLRLLLACHVHRRMGGLPIARALDLRMQLASQIDECLEKFDLLVTPTVCKVAEPLPEAPPSRESLVLHDGTELLFNTVPLDLTGHPALTLPCGTADNDLPVGLQMIGRRYSEAALYKVATLFEEDGTWKPY